MTDLLPLVDWARAYITLHPKPDFEIGHLPRRPPHIRRWHILPRNEVSSVYLHEFLDSDHDLDFHDHPYHSRSLLLTGRYSDHFKDGTCHSHAPGDTIIRDAQQAHRIELLETPCLSLFFTGSVFREWGWYHKSGWIPWEEYIRRRTEGTL